MNWASVALVGDGVVTGGDEERESGEESGGETSEHCVPEKVFKRSPGYEPMLPMPKSYSVISVTST